MAYGFVCLTCGRMEAEHDGMITEADGAEPGHIILSGYKFSFFECQKLSGYVASKDEKEVIIREYKKRGGQHEGQH